MNAVLANVYARPAVLTNVYARPALRVGRCVLSSKRRRAVAAASLPWSPSPSTQEFNRQLQHLSKHLFSIQDGSGKLLGALLPIAIAVCLSHYLKMGLAKDIQIAVFRSSAQLVVAGLLLKLAFDGEGLFLSACLVLFMVITAGYTAGERAKMLPKSQLVATVSIIVGCVGTLTLILSMKVFPIEPRFIIPTAGYVIGNSMSMVGGTLNRLYNDIKLSEGQVEAALALGASPYQAVHHYVERSVAQGMGPMVDGVKTAGLISLPGSMTGMLMGGSSPLEAVQMQLQVLYMVLGCAAVSSTISSLLGWRMMFTKSQQLLLD